MVNCTDPVSNCQYNISKLLDGNLMVNDTPSWIQIFDSLTGGFVVITMLAVLGLVVFILMRRQTNNDTEALAYSGLLTTIVGVFLFIIPTVSGAKLIIWSRLLPFIILTAISLYLNFTNQNY